MGCTGWGLGFSVRGRGWFGLGIRVLDWGKKALSDSANAPMMIDPTVEAAHPKALAFPADVRVFETKGLGFRFFPNPPATFIQTPATTNTFFFSKLS